MTDNPIDALLKAEQDAEAEIARCRDGARETVNRALQQARTIRERADKRIADIHTHCAAALDAESLRLWQAYTDDPQTPLDLETTPERIDAIVARVAEQLTGDGDG